MLDTLIVGAGPAGLATAIALKKEGLNYQIIEKGPVGNHIAQYPTFMRFFSTRELLEIDEFPLTIVDEKPTRQEYIAYLARLVRDRELKIRDYTEVKAVIPLEDGTFEVAVQASGGDEQERMRARSVVVACGAWESPRKLGVPGEELDKVTSRFTEAHPYVGKKVLVVGGRNSAVETALHLYRAGADVSLSYRREDFEGFGLKYWLKPDIENRVHKGEIKGYLGTNVIEIKPKSVVLEHKDGRREEVDNDFVIKHIGYDPPVGFLKSMGVEIDPGTNRPRHNEETLESNVPGLFIAGVITHGNVSGSIFIENCRYHGELILKGLRERLRKPVEA